VDEAEDGASALAAARRLRPDVVLLDVLLPDTTGFEIAEQLSGDPEAPMVVLTSSRELADLGGSVERSRARGFIAKKDLTASAVTALVGEAT
jgi:CheY-like chemotaxis protein